MARARGANATMAAAFESTYGTPPGSGYLKLPFVSSALGEQQGLIASDLLGFGRDPLPPSLDVVNNTGDVVVPVDLRNFGNWLKLYFGQPTSAGSVAATGAYNFSAQPAANSTITVNGTTFTFVASGATGNQVNIGANLAATMTALAAALNASAVSGVAQATYAATSTSVTVTNDALGTVGNGFTMAAGVGSNCIPNNQTLTGGAQTHTFVSGSEALPSMSIEVGLPDVPSFGMNFGVMGDKLKVALARSGLLNATCSLIAQGETLSTSTSAGTPTSQTLQRFTQAIGQVKLGGQVLANVVSADFTYDNQLEAAEDIRQDGRIDGADPGIVAMTGSIVARFADTVMLNQATAGTPAELTFGWQLSAAQSLLVTCHSVFLPKVNRPITGPKGVQATFNWQAALDPTLQKTCTIALTNNVYSY